MTASTPSPFLEHIEKLSVYIHIPWCVQKCPYCDFNSHHLPTSTRSRSTKTIATTPPMLETRYVEALCADLTESLKAHPELATRTIRSIFFGGGTPSLLSGAAIADILNELHRQLQLSPKTEITLEANAGVSDTDRFNDFAKAGINRLSLGVQSFNDDHLRAIGRIHDGQTAQQAAKQALAYFKHVNLDLMYALPQQTPAQALDDIHTALSLSNPKPVTHLSVYQLTIEPNTLFAMKPPPLPDDDTTADMGEAIATCLHDAGFMHYEVSAFAKPGFACEHNLHYWQFGDYLGLGAGAHSKIRTPHKKTIRQMRWKHPHTYLEKAIAKQPIAEEHPVLPTALPFEFLMNALRLRTGFYRQDFEQCTGVSMSSIASPLQQATSQGLLTITPAHHKNQVNTAPPMTFIQTTSKGQQHLNGLLRLFL